MFALILSVCANAGGDVPLAVLLVEPRVAMARSLVAYDVAAWQTTDAMLTAGTPVGLGREWFVVETAEGLTGWYGRYDPDTDRWHPLAAYRLGRDRVVVPVELVLDPAVADPRGRAIRSAWTHGFPRGLVEMVPEVVSPNLYVFEVHDGLDVWVLPSLGRDGSLVTTSCAVQHYSPDGRTLLGEEVERRKTKTFPMGPDHSVVLKSISKDLPTVCELFWAYYYADDYARIVVRAGGRDYGFEDVEGVGRMLVATKR